MPVDDTQSHGGENILPNVRTPEGPAQNAGERDALGITGGPQLVLPGLEVVLVGDEEATRHIRHAPTHVNQHVARGRESVRGFADAASVDRPEERLDPYQPLDPATVAINRRWMARIRAAHPSRHPQTPSSEQPQRRVASDPAGPPPRELMEEARTTSVTSGRMHKLERDASGAWRIVPC